MSSAPRTTSMPGSAVAIGCGAPIERAWATHAAPDASFAPAGHDEHRAQDDRGDRAERLHQPRPTSIVRPSRAANTSTPSSLPHRAAEAVQAVDHVVVVGRVVVVQRQPLGADLAGQEHGVLDRAVPPVALALELGRRVLRVVDQQIDALAQPPHLLVDQQPPGRLLVVAHVGDARAVVRDAVADASRRRAAPAPTPRRSRRRRTGPAPPGCRSCPGSRRARSGTCGGQIVSRSTSAAQRPSSCAGAYTTSSASSSWRGVKNGRPCTWSQCRWLTRQVPRKGSSAGCVRPK